MFFITISLSKNWSQICQRICVWRKDSGTSYVRGHEGAHRGSGCVNSIKREGGLWLDIILSDSFRSRPAEEKNGACKSSWSSWSTVSTAESGQPCSRVGIFFFFIQAIPSRERKLRKKRRENDVALLMRENGVICHNNSQEENKINQIFYPTHSAFKDTRKNIFNYV